MPRCSPGVQWDIDDSELFPKLAELYAIGPLAGAERRPTRVSGFPGLVTLTASNGRRIVVKQDNDSDSPVDRMRQRDVSFQQRCCDLGLPAPRPVLTPEGTHGSLPQHRVGRRTCYLQFTASEFVEGRDLSKVKVDTEVAEAALAQAGRVGALLRVASATLVPWLAYPQGEPAAMRATVARAYAAGFPWARTLQKALPSITAIAATLPLERGYDYVAPLDLSPKDAMLLDDGRVSFVDWQYVNTHQCSGPLPEWVMHDWRSWACKQGVSPERASQVIEYSFTEELERRMPSNLGIDLGPNAAAWEQNYLSLIKNAARATHPGRILDAMRSDAAERVQAHLQALYELAPQHMSRLPPAGTELGLN